MTKTKENLKGFRELLASRIAYAKRTDVEVAEAIGVSKGLVSQLRTGALAPSQKVIPSLAWALHQSPSALYDDVCLFLKEAGFPTPCKPLTEVAGMAKESIWIIVPPHIDIPAETTLHAIQAHTQGRDRKVLLFTTPKQATECRELKSPLPPHFFVKTPSEILLNIEYPLVFVNPENDHARRVFRGVPSFPDFHLVEIKETAWSAHLLANFIRESHFLNVAELAVEERRHGENSLVILYTNYFPEEDEQLLYEAVKQNLSKNARYLYLVPTMGGIEAQVARLTYNRLRNKLDADGHPVAERSYKLIPVNSPLLFREGTFVLYASPSADGPPEPKALYRQLEGDPIRFTGVGGKALAEFYVTLLNPLLADDKEIREWLTSTADGT